MMHAALGLNPKSLHIELIHSLAPVAYLGLVC